MQYKVVRPIRYAIDNKDCAVYAAGSIIDRATLYSAISESNIKWFIDNLYLIEVKIVSVPNEITEIQINNAVDEVKNEIASIVCDDGAKDLKIKRRKQNKNPKTNIINQDSANIDNNHITE